VLRLAVCSDADMLACSSIHATVTATVHCIALMVQLVCTTVSVPLLTRMLKS
jgi:hypothetical protein